MGAFPRFADAMHPVSPFCRKADEETTHKQAREALEQLRRLSMEIKSFSRINIP